ncbi:MAG: hypothetical protein MZV64_31705 [Ignavibacteriales bacterium]|nr:hypothetical protein [Ignavibacteriales bacterium]
MAASPLSIDDIAMQLDIDIMEASRRVSMLELDGAVRTD